MSATTYGKCLLFHGGGLCPLSNRYLSTLADELKKKEIFEQIFMGFYSFECLLNPEEFIKPWDYSLKATAKKSHGGFYGTNRDVNLIDPELQKQAIATCKTLGINWIGVAGGDGSCRQVAEISEAFEAEGIHFFIPMPLTIDGIEGGFSLGLSPAVRKAYEVLDDLAATNLQTRENNGFSVLFLELQGRNRDDILAHLLKQVIDSDALGGIPLADIDLFVVPTNYRWDKNKLIEAIKGTKKRTVVIYSEGAKFPVNDIIKAVGRKVRTSVVGYLSQMNKLIDLSDRITIDIVIEDSASVIAACMNDNKLGYLANTSFSLVFNYGNSLPRVEPIDYWAKLNPREGQKPTLSPELEELLKKYTP